MTLGGSKPFYDLGGSRMRNFQLPALMTKIEVASYTGFSERTVGEMISKGELPQVRLPGRRARYRKADVDRVFGLDGAA